MPKVSVVISTYNRPARVRKAIQSVLGQSFQDFEIWVVGDNCDKQTGMVVSAIKDPRVKYFNTPIRHGLEDHGSTPKNIGIEKSSGDYIAYLDDDDEFFPNHLLESVRFLDANPDVDLLYGSSLVLKWLDHRKSVVRDRAFDPNDLENRPFINTSEIVHRRSLLDKLGKPWWGRVGYLNDYDFTKRVNRVGKIAHSSHVAATQHFPYSRLLELERARFIKTNKVLPRLSVVIGHRDRTRYLEECLKSLENQDTRAINYEVIIVEHGKRSPAVQSIVKKYSRQIRVVELRDRGPYHRGWVCNVGARNSLSDLFCFLDCDCLVPSNFVTTVIRTAEQQPDSSFMIRLRRKWLSESDTSRYFAKKMFFAEASEKSILDTNTHAVGSGIVIPRSSFFNVGGYDEKYDKGWGFEDVDLFERLTYAGSRVIETYPENYQVHLWHPTGDHPRVERGDHYRYWKKVSRHKDSPFFLVRNKNIYWGAVPREII